MIIKSSAPTRISFLGGGTDLDIFSSEYGGAVMNMSINLRQHVTLRLGDDKWEKPSHNFPPDADPQLCYEILKEYDLNGMHRDISVESSFDGIIGAGLGSSGAFSVALVAALERNLGHALGRYRIAELAYKIESKMLTTGRQDHYAASYGGFNVFTFGKTNKSSPLSRRWVEEIYPFMVLFYIGGRGDSKVQIENLSPLKIKALKSMRDLLLKAVEGLSKGNIFEFAQLIDLSWKMKREISDKVSNQKIDSIYDKGIKNGAWGGKLLGAGGGGHMLFFIPPEERMEFIENMDLEAVDFMPDFQGVSCRVV